VRAQVASVSRAYAFEAVVIISFALVMAIVIAAASVIYPPALS
jgi:hypothetical protein